MIESVTSLSLDKSLHIRAIAGFAGLPKSRVISYRVPQCGPVQNRE